MAAGVFLGLAGKLGHQNCAGAGQDGGQLAEGGWGVLRGAEKGDRHRNLWPLGSVKGRDGCGASPLLQSLSAAVEDVVPKHAQGGWNGHIRHVRHKAERLGKSTNGKARARMVGMGSARGCGDFEQEQTEVTEGVDLLRFLCCLLFNLLRVPVSSVASWFVGMRKGTVAELRLIR